MQQEIKTEMKKVFNIFVEKLKKKENVNLPCVAHQINFKGNKIIEEKNENNINQLNFLRKRISDEVVDKFVSQKDLSTEEFIKISLSLSMNRLMNLSHDYEFKSFFKNFNEFFNVLYKYDKKNIKKCLLIFEEKLAWEFSEFLLHLKNKKIQIKHLLILIKYFCNLSIFFEFEYFEGFNIFQNILQLLNWKEFEYLFLFEDQNLKQNKTLSQEHPNQLYLKHQTVLSKNELEQLIETLQNFITIQLMEETKFSKLKKEKVKVLRPICYLLDFVWNFNQYLSLNIALDESFFINSYLSDDFKFKDSFLFFIREKILREKRYSHLRRRFKTPLPFGSFNFMNHRFLYSVERKVEILEFESTLEQHFNFQQGFNLMEMLQFGSLSMGLELTVSRNSLLEDALTQLTKGKVVKNLKKPLKVKFRGEPGMDEGGLTKEFFHLITQELFSPKFGMFTIKNEVFWWMNKDSISCNLNFELIGMLMGLAIYNKTLLDLKFPLVLYKKLILDHYLQRGLTPSRKETLSLKDLAEIEPQLFSTLTNILAMDLPEGNEVGITFEISFDSWGISKNYNLIPNGHKTPVTNDNKKLFVQKYIDWVFNLSIEKQYKPFAIGFFKVLGDSVLQIFSAKDLQMTICGRTDLDFNELKNGARYQDGFIPTSLTVQHFWKILKEEFNEEDKKKFLKFLSGNDRAPLRGLAEIKMTISK